jgi:hypothetical protein
MLSEIRLMMVVQSLPVEKIEDVSARAVSDHGPRARWIANRARE